MKKRHAQSLSELLTQCLVQIDGTAIGSGFFAAPGVVVTAAHVVGGYRGSLVKVSWEGDTFTGTVLCTNPSGAGDIWPEPDLAVVRLERPPQHPCVWLDRRLPRSEHTRFTVAGFSNLLGKLDVRVSELQGGGVQGRLIHLTNNELTLGMSGGAVLNRGTDGVCAVTKASRELDTDLGGFATPLQDLWLLDPEVATNVWRENDRFHGRDNRWMNLTRQAPVRITAEEEMKLRAALADMPQAADHQRRFLAVAAAGTTLPVVGLFDYGDVVAELGEMHLQDGDLPYVVAYVCDLARSSTGSVRKRLEHWALLVAARLEIVPSVVARLELSNAAPLVVSSMVQVRPASNDSGRFLLTIWRCLAVDNIVPVLAESASLPLPEIWRTIREILPGEIAYLGQHADVVLVEFFLPTFLMDEPLDTWSLWPDDDGALLGLCCPIVVRQITRSDSVDSAVQWRRRWDVLAGTDAGVCFVSTPRDTNRSAQADFAWLRSKARQAALVLSGSPNSGPSRQMFAKALLAGVPVVAWRRDGCQGCGDADVCAGRGLHRDLSSEVAGATVTELPRRLWQLRCEAVAEGRDGHWTRELVLLWDDPYRRPAQDRLVSPSERSREWTSG